MGILVERGFTPILFKHFQETLKQNEGSLGGDFIQEVPQKVKYNQWKTTGQEQQKVLPLAVAAEKNATRVGCGKPAHAQHGPGCRSPVHFSEICLTWFEAESGFRIEIWTRQYRQIVKNFDPCLMEITLRAPDIIEKSKNNEMFQT